MRPSSKLQAAFGVFLMVGCVWLVSLLGSAVFNPNDRDLVVPDHGTGAKPILPSDVPPAPPQAVLSGGQDGLRWSLVAAEASNLRCFGLKVSGADVKARLVCNTRSLGAENPLGGVVLASAELHGPVVFGEAWQGVTDIEGVWEHGAHGRFRVDRLSPSLGTGIKLFLVVLPDHVQRLRLVARDANDDVVGSLRICCPASGVRHPPLLEWCHGEPQSEHLPGRRQDTGLGGLMTCPPVDVAWGVEFMSRPQRPRL
jgi:hypothetical protein